MIVTTTSLIEGRPVSQYLGVIAGEAVMGANIFKDIFAGVRNIIGGRSGAYEKELESAREAAFEDIRAKAAEMGADAIVGVDIDYEVISATGGGGGSMLLVSVSGTAAKLS